MIKAILFDFGGVIYEHPKGIVPEVIARIYDQPLEVAVQGYAEYSDDYAEGRIATNDLVTTLSFLLKSNKSVEEVKRLWLKHYQELATVNPKIIDLIRRLKSNYKLYLLTNITEMNDLYNRNLGVYELFDGLFKSFEMKLKKPNPMIYDKVISDLNLEPQEILFIDDDIINLIAAQKIGVKTILFNVLENSPEELEGFLKLHEIKLS